MTTRTKALAVGVGLLMFAGGCTAPEKTRALLESQGYTAVAIHGWQPYSCSTGEGGDWFSTGFSAYAPVTELPISGTVCAGLLFKDATIRFDFSPTRP